MDRHAGSKPGMTENGLEKLLQSLSENREQAAGLYLHLQGKLIRYFTWNTCPHPEDLADEVLDRVARRLEEGEQIERPTSYILGVARRVAMEAKRKSAAAILPSGKIPGEAVLETSTVDALDCLERCLETLPAESRTLLLEYYSGKALARVDVRQRIADRLGLSVNALRNRVLRLRRNLESCIGECCGGGPR